MLFIGFFVCAFVAYAAMQRGSLTPGGALTAVVVGTVTFVLGGGVAGLALLAFFLSSSALSRYRRREKQQLMGGIVEKGDTRDAMQVLANGGPAALFCIAYAATGKPVFYAGALGALAAANADTWATELGLLSPTPPRDVLTFAETAPGTSGAVSTSGLLGSLAGAAVIGMLALLEFSPGCVARAALITVAGFAGGFGDSLLGATIQERRQCQSCGATTEQLRHSCENPEPGEILEGETVCVAGIEGLGNDAVNAIATAWGGALAALLCALFLTA